MKCMEIFYRRWQAEKFVEQLQNEKWNANPELEEAVDEDADNLQCWIVYFNPKPLRCR